MVLNTLAPFPCTAASDSPLDSHLDLGRAPYVLYGAKYIGPVSLAPLFQAKQEDDEIVLQIVYVFYKLVYFEATRGLVLGQWPTP